MNIKEKRSRVTWVGVKMRVWKLLGNYVLYKYPNDVYLFTKIPYIYIYMYIKYFINNLFHFIKIFFF